MKRLLALAALFLTTAATSAQVIIIDGQVVGSAVFTGPGLSDGVVSNVTLAGTDLVFTGADGGFTGSVSLASLIGAGLPDGDYGAITITGGVWSVDTDAVTTTTLQDLSVTTQKLALAAVTTDQLANGAVNSAKVLDNTIQTDDILDGTLNSNDIANNGVLVINLSTTATPTDGQRLVFDSASGGLRPEDVNDVTDGDKSDITVSGNGATWSVNANAIGSAEVQDGTLTGNDIQDLTISGQDITNSAITPEKIAAANSAQDNYVLTKTPGSQSATWVDPNSIGGGGGGVTDGDKGDIVISSAGTVWDIDAGVITAVEIVDNAVTSSEISNGSIDPVDLENADQGLGSGLDGYVWTYDDTAGDFALVSRVVVANSILAENNIWGGNQTFNGTVDFSNALGVEADQYFFDDGDPASSASILHNNTFLQFNVNPVVGSSEGYQIRHGGPIIDSDLATKLYVDTQIAGVGGGGGDVFLASNQTFTGQNDFSQRVRTVSVPFLADATPVSNFAFQMTHNLVSSGLFNTSGNDAQLILRDDGGNTDINLVADGTSSIAGGLQVAGSDVVTVGDTGTVSGTMIAGNAITSAKIDNGTIVADDIGTGAVGTDEVANNTLTTDDLGTDSVNSDEIAADAVGSSEIAGGAVGSSEIAAGNVQEVHLAVSNTPTQGDIFEFNSGTGGFTAIDPSTLGGLTTSRNLLSTATSYTPTTANLNEVTKLTNAAEITLNTPTGSYSAGDTMCFQQGGAGKVRLNFSDNVTGETLRSPVIGAAFCLDYDGASWNVIGNTEFVDVTAPATPLNLSAGTATDTTLEWTWDAVTDTGTTYASASGIQEYEISFDGGLSESVGTNTSYTRTGLSSATTHGLRVKSIDNEGNESSFSSSVNNTTTSGAIYNLADAADPNNEGNSVANWSKASGSAGITITSSTNGPQNGSYEVSIAHDGPDNNSANVELDLSSVLSPNTAYTITLYLRRGTGSTGNWRFDLDTSIGGWSSFDTDPGLITSSAGNSYVQYTLGGTTDAGPDHEIEFVFNSNSDDADVMYIDNIVITEN